MDAEIHNTIMSSRKLSEKKKLLLCTVVAFLMDDKENEESSSEEESDSNSSGESDDELVLLLLAAGDAETERDPPVARIVPRYNFDDFRSSFHITKTTFEMLLGIVDKSRVIPIFSRGKECIDSERHLLITVWYLTHTEPVRNLADRFSVSESTVVLVVRRILRFLTGKLMKVMLQWPSGNRLVEIKEHYSNGMKVPDVIGVLGENHIRIRKPKHNEKEYRNRYGYHSIVLQAVVDFKMLFMDVYCEAPGRSTSVSVLNKSPLYSKIKSDAESFFPNGEMVIAPSSYPALKWLVTPFRENGLSSQELEFNSKLIAVIKHAATAFGMLRGRFQKLQNLYITRISLAPQIISSCIVLHNICTLSEENCMDFYDVIVDEEQMLHPTDWQHTEEYSVSRTLLFHKMFLNSNK